MIPIRLLNGSVLYINADLLESVVGAHDTILTLTSGRKIVSSTRPEEVLEAVVAYRRRIQAGPEVVPAKAPAQAGSGWPEPRLTSPPDPAGRPGCPGSGRAT